MTKTKNKLTILGSGTSTGIPMVGCKCSVCNSPIKENYRLRTSIHLQTSGGRSIIVDTTPDLRHQLLLNKINKIDLAFITHDHADHTHGIDDLRPLTFPPNGKSIPIYTYDKCVAQLTKKFSYIFRPNDQLPNIGGGIPRLSLETVNIGVKNTILGEEFEFLLLKHGHTETLGIIHQKMAYIIDCSELEKDQITYLRDKELDLLILDCVTNREHKTHLWQDRSFEYISQIRPKECGLIHMNHSLDHDQLKSDAKKTFSFPVYPTFDSQILYY